jgi:16S rRNA (cytosine967-C5)-methyltransferase
VTPAARIQAAIDLLAEIEALDAPADRQAGEYFRGRRYIGSKDRRAVGDRVYAVLRSRSRLDWWLERGSGEAGGVRGRLVAFLSLCREEGAEALAALFDGEGHHPAPLSAEELAFAQALDGEDLDHSEQPDWVRHELPEWLWTRFESSLGQAASSELAGLNQEAPLDLRANSLKTDRAGALAALAADGIEAEPTPLSPLGLRIAGRRVLPNLSAYRDGLVEVQDEGSQLVALLTDARPGMRVADLCAGAGGKALALAAAMENRSGLAALDRDARRLERARPRLMRAGATEVELRQLPGQGDTWWREAAGSFDRVLVDAPCSGSGAWRRNPDARWRLSEAALERHRNSQAGVLSRAATLVAPGGRLVYATCSLLDEENSDQVARFLEQRADFSLLPVAGIWAEVLGGDCPAEGPELLLTPARHGTDGFYLAILERGAAP